MATLTIGLSDKALEILREYTAIKKTMPEEYVKESLKFIEIWVNDEQRKEEGFKKARQYQKQKEADEIYKKYRGHTYTLKKQKDGKYLEIYWRTCSIQDDPRHYKTELKSNIGKYYLRITQCQRMKELTKSIGIPTSHQIEDKIYTFNSLKILKKNVNKWFEKYGYGPYYKVRKNRRVR